MDVETVKYVLKQVQAALPQATAAAAAVAPTYTITDLAEPWYVVSTIHTTTVAHQPPAQDFTSTISVTLDSLSVLLVDDAGDIDRPLLSLLAALDVTLGGVGVLGQATGDLTLDLAFYVALAVYNEGVSAWEPVIDPQWANLADRRRALWPLMLKVLQTRGAENRLEIDLQSGALLQLTVSAEALGALSRSAFLSSPSKKANAVPDTSPVLLPSSNATPVATTAPRSAFLDDAESSTDTQLAVASQPTDADLTHSVQKSSPTLTVRNYTGLGASLTMAGTVMEVM